MNYLNREAYEALMQKARAVSTGKEDDDLGILGDATRDAIEYVCVVCNGENTLNTAGDADAALRGSYDARRHNAHEKAISSVKIINRLAEIHGVGTVFTGDTADRHQVADFCIEIAGWLFTNRRRVL